MQLIALFVRNFLGLFIGVLPWGAKIWKFAQNFFMV